MSLHRLVTLSSLATIGALVHGCGSKDNDEFVDPTLDSGASSGGSHIQVGDSGQPDPDGSSARPACGNTLIDAAEQCDDGNGNAGDGCSASCQLEAGWTCKTPGASCEATTCGDGIVAGTEDCDDASTTDADGGTLHDGCSALCTLEPGYQCLVAGQPCTPTTCGDGNKEGTEQCDDGNLHPFDGCAKDCTLEPTCTAGTCVAACGDGLKFPSEACDDGNTRDGDGCSATCVLEEGFTCENQASELPDQLVLPIVYRDFAPNGQPGGHPDFEHYDSPNPVQVTKHLVQDTLGADGFPVFASAYGRNEADTAANPTQQLTGAPQFAQWWGSDLPAKPFYDQTLTLGKNGNTYVFSSTAFFPLDGMGWGNQNSGRNFGFTSELRYWFTYGGGENLQFFGDDDVWVFVNGKLAVDIGGRHSQEAGEITLDAAKADELGLEVGGLYEVDVFQAEVHTGASNYKLTLGGFVKVVTTCTAKCGDGVKTKYEACDDGQNLGGYGQCAPGCVLGPRCGDGIVDSANGEVCDDGNQVDNDTCSASCQSSTVH